MARIKKKGKAGAAKNYVTRNQAIRKLQISLPDFRKLCIWKGIYPREPRSRKKDIQYLLHEPLLQKFRDQKVLEKKISRALGRGDVTDASRLEKNAARPEKTGKPRYTLDHVIRERYPTFVDALRDLDDCLSMLFLFANLPSTTSVPAKMVARCERLCLEFQHYLIVSQSVTKSFLSIKGIYYQANIQGEDVLWLVPYKFNQRVVGDVDFRIMGTFIEFYMTLLGFINFRLYTSIGLKYPPKFDQVMDENAAELGAFTLEGKTLVGAEEHQQKQLEAAEHKPDPKVQAAVNKVIKKIKGSEAENDSTPATENQVEGEDQDAGVIDKFEPAAPGGDVLPQPSNTGNNPNNLFSNLTIYLSRETPPTTSRIVDRPPIQAVTEEDGDDEDNQTSQKLAANRRVPGRTYIQPQWVWDSVNDGELKEPHLYAPGASLPPHLSPFVKSVQGAYDPTIPLEEQEPEEEAIEAQSDGEDEVDDTVEGMDVANSDEEEDGEDAEDDEFGGFSEDEQEEDEDEDDAEQRQQELEAELYWRCRQAREEAEDIERAKGMLSKKKRKLYEQMVYTNTKKSAEDQKLRAKRRKLEKEKAKGKAK
ncbi:mRNA-binding ribosome synthesis protein nop7 [Fusarium falciforme]|nr:mRNA-binding ribosome synthesis protein nop7 [Fusarium falciforme]